jgi:hypothetical protein
MTWRCTGRHHHHHHWGGAAVPVGGAHTLGVAAAVCRMARARKQQQHDTSEQQMRESCHATSRLTHGFELSAGQACISTATATSVEATATAHRRTCTRGLPPPRYSPATHLLLPLSRFHCPPMHVAYRSGVDGEKPGRQLAARQLLPCGVVSEHSHTALGSSEGSGSPRQPACQQTTSFWQQQHGRHNSQGDLGACVALKCFA